MTLRSHLFRDNRALQACLVSDPAHVTPGSTGPHVALIQSALVRLRYLTPQAALTEPAVYGPQTARAVLSYKRDFNVVNRRYQTQADNIVGKMTIASLDHAIWVLDGGDGPPRRAGYPGLHPASPKVTPTPPADEASARTHTAKSLTGSMAIRETGTGAFQAPLSALPPDMQEVIRRSNDEKIPGKMQLFPYVAVHEGPLSADELSRRFADKLSVTSILQDLHTRMRPFGIWKLIRTIESVYAGTGAHGIFCSPFDHAAALAHMFALTKGPVTPMNPLLAQIKLPLTDSKFCKDGFNVHGERDSFREMVKQGPGLHICITNASGRTRTDEKYPFCDFHIDHVQQGQVCVDGICLPIMNGQTIEHLKTVGPWLLDQPGEWLKKHAPQIPRF